MEPSPESEPPNQPLQPEESSVGSAAGSSAGSSAGVSSEPAESPLPASCWDSVGAADDGASLLAPDASSHPAIPTPRTRARRTGAAVLSSPRRRHVEEGTDPTEERKNTVEIEGRTGAFTKASSYEKGWWAASQENRSTPGAVIVHAGTKCNRIDTQDSRRHSKQKDATIINLPFLNFRPARLEPSSRPTPSFKPHPHARGAQTLREHKRLRQHPRNTGFGCLVLNRFTADGARRAASAPGHKEAMPTTTIRPSARNGILIHTSCLIPCGARPGTSPFHQEERLLLDQPGPGPHSTHTPPPRGSTPRRRAAARPEPGSRGEQGRGTARLPCRDDLRPGETTRASIGAWQSSPPFRFRAPCPASPS